MAGTDQPQLPTVDDARMVGFLTRLRVRAAARSRAASAALAELSRQDDSGGDAE